MLIEKSEFYKVSCLPRRPNKKTINGCKKNLEHSTSSYNLFFCASIFRKQKKEDIKLPNLPEDVHIIRLGWYSNNKKWMQDLVNLTYKTSNDIRKNLSFNLIIKKLRFNLVGFKKEHHVYNYGTVSSLIDLDKFQKGKEYLERYSDKCGKFDGKTVTFSPKPNDEYKNANVCKITSYRPNSYLIQSGSKYDSGVSNLKYAKAEYEKLRSKNNPDLKDINRSVATIHWLIAQENPFKDTNDLTANILTKAIYHSYGVKLSPVKDATDLNFEAYYNDLDDYIENYPNFFEKPPEK